ncbi:hypothetical protein Pla52nx_006427 [Stieleria varia]
MHDTIRSSLRGDTACHEAFPESGPPSATASVPYFVMHSMTYEKAV